MNRKYFLPLFLILQILSIKCLSYCPEWVEKYYSNGFYCYLTKFYRNLFGWIPFSFGDILYGLLIFWIIYWLIKTKKLPFKEKALKVLGFISIVYFVFHLSWAFNYYRLPLAVKMNIKEEYTNEELLNFTKKLIAKTNGIHYKITKDATAKVVIPYKQNEIFDYSIKNYKKLAKDFPLFEYGEPSQKKSLFSLPLTYMGFGGYFNPFTHEAQVNYKIPMYHFPSTTCHEMAHQMGIGSENECNFISFLATTRGEDLYFKYSGYTHALNYCLYHLSMKNFTDIEVLTKSLHTGVLKNLEESHLFWQSYHSFIETGFKITYDQFLKSNQQEDGIESYSKFIDLLVNYYQDKAI